MQSVTVLITGLTMGVTVLLGKAVGANDAKAAGEVVSGQIRLFTIVAAALTFVMLLLAPQAAQLMNVPEEALPETVRYVRICSAGIVFITAYNGISGVFRALGNSRSPFLFVLIACLMNVALDLLFVGVFGMNAAGAALATVIAQAASVFFSLAYTRRHPLPFAIGNPLRAGGAAIRGILRVGSPIALQDFLTSLSFLIITSIVNGLGLIASALIMIFMGVLPWGSISIPVAIMAMFCLLFINGWMQGMGWPPCGRVMTHWFCTKERGVKMSVWNVAHNIGGAAMAPLAAFGITLGYTLFGDPLGGAFYVPALVALAIAVIAYLMVRDTPQSCGLPPVEIWKHETKQYSASNEKEMTVRQILFENVLNNKLLWLIAFANAFIYFVRYGVLDWAPSYLTTSVADGGKGMALDGSSWSYFIFEIAGIFGTILCGWLSDKVFKGRRAPATIIYMALVMVAVYVYWQSRSELVTNVAMGTIGFLIYGPVMLIGVSALDLVPKKAAGTAAGFTGLFGYLIGSAFLANIGMGYIFQHFGWDGGFIALIGACVLSIGFSASTWNREKQYIA